MLLRHVVSRFALVRFFASAGFAAGFAIRDLMEPDEKSLLRRAGAAVRERVKALCTPTPRPPEAPPVA